MADPRKAVETQLANIEARTGKSLVELATLLKSSGLARHGELRDFLKQKLALGHGDANAVVAHVLSQAGAASQVPGNVGGDLLAGIYTGPKSGLRPIHEALVKAIDQFGQYEVAPKKGYVSLRRKKQFAMIGPATNTRVELGLNMKGVAATARLVEMPAGGMCNYKVKLTQVDDVDPEVILWVRRAFDNAG
jgi:Domain of unknown function (DUF5655)/Domain of unknown function (DUF4287)